MAVLGVQLVVSMVLASVLSKVSPRYSFARWILCSRLVRYLYPSDEELRKLCGIPPPGSKHSKVKKGEDKKKEDSFTVPKNLALELESAPVTAIDILPLNFYTEFQWLLDFSLCAILVHLLTEVYYITLRPAAEFNLSVMWCVLVIGFSIKILYSLTAIYFRTEEGGERILCILFGFFFLVFAMGILIINEDHLEFGLENAYYNFSQGAKQFLEMQEIDSAGPASFLTFRIILAFVSAILGAFLTFPGLRLAKMHTDALKYAKDSSFFQILLHLNIVFPLILSLMWLKPIMRDFIVKKSNMIISDDMFDAVRLGTVLLFCMLRFTLVWAHLQAHLNLAWEKVSKLQKEAGRIKAVDLQKMIIRVFYYLCVVALQYLAPMVLLLFCTLLWKTLGEVSLGAPFGFEYLGAAGSAAKAQAAAATKAQFSLALSNFRLVFTPVFFRALFSFFSWWICATWFTTSAFGLVYYSYFESNLS